MGYLTSLACRNMALQGAQRVLQTTTPSDGSLAELDQSLAQCDRLDGLRSALLGERAYGSSAFEEMTSTAPVYALPLTLTLRQGRLHHFEFLTDVADAPSYRAAVALLDAEKGSSHPLHAMTRLTAPAVSAAWQAACRNAATLRALRILTAVERKKLDPAKEFRLADLGLPDDALRDPFDDAPLRVRWKTGDVVVYSIGTDLVDDGGDIDKEKDVGLRRPQAAPKPARSK